MKEVKVSCWQCGHGNWVNLDKYAPEHEYIGLYSICMNCDQVYKFDVEIKYLSRSFNPGDWDE